MELAKSFEPADIEKRWYAQWESAGYFKAGNVTDAPAYCIMLPARCTWGMPSSTP